jgi:putative methionine-R-sulfoxide reductase with GAF domain
MGQLLYDFTKSSIKEVYNSKDKFVKEVTKASKVLLPHERENLINWLFFYTADKPDTQKWFYEILDKNVLVS